MDPPRRKSLRFTEKTTSTPAKRAKKKDKPRSIPDPIVPNVDSQNIADGADNPAQIQASVDSNAIVVPDNNAAQQNQTNNPINTTDSSRQNDPEVIQSTNIIEAYAQVLQQESESCTLLAFNSENWMELEIKLSVIEHRLTKLNGGMRDAIRDNDIRLETAYRTAINMVEPYFITAKAALEDRITHLKQQKGNTAQTSSLNLTRDTNQTINVQLDPTDFYLKPVELESFDGSYAKWVSFREDFIDQVHKNDKIKPVNKLRRLKALVKGQAAVTLGSWQATSSGYTGAWEKLCRVYDNPYLIARAHIEDIFSVPSVARLTNESLRLLIDTVTNAKRQLEEMGVDLIELIIMHIMCKKLDDRTCADWEMKRNSRAVPELHQFIDFLEKKARALTNIDNKSLMFSSNKPSNVNTTNNRSSDRRFKPYTTNRNERYVNTNSASGTSGENQPKSDQAFRPCKQCQGNHGLFRCLPFSKLPLEIRWKKVRDWSLCKNCLNSYHDLRFCRVNVNPCRRCPGEYHNSILCPNFIYNQSITATVTSSNQNAAAEQSVETASKELSE